MANTFQRNQVYHSALRQVSEKEGVWVMFTGEDSGKSPKFHFRVSDLEGNVESAKYTLVPENNLIEAQIRALELKRWYLVRAHGSREEAHLDVQDEAGTRCAPAEEFRSAPRAAEKERAEPEKKAPPQEQEAKKRADPREGAEKRVMFECLTDAAQVAYEFNKRQVDPGFLLSAEDVRAIGITFYIERHKAH